jgi:predicted Zn-dependent protease
MVSLLDSEAQLAYVLAHEMAHVLLEHWRDLVTMQHGL